MAEQRTKRPRGPMGGPGRGMMPGEKPKDFKNSIGKLVRYLGRYWYAIVAVMIFAAVSTVFSVAGPKVMARATNALVEGLGKKIAGTGSIDFTYIAKVLLFTLGLYICSAVFSFIQGMIMTGITQKTCYRMRKEISEKINRMPMKYLSDLYSVSLDYLLSDSADAPEQNRRISNEPDGEMVTISDSADGGKKGKQKTAKWLAILMVVVALITVIVITYLNQKETEPIEQNTVKFEELQKDERISDSNAVESGPVS